MRRFLIVVGVSFLFGGAAHADRIAHVFAKGRGAASPVETTHVNGITRTDQAIGTVASGHHSSLTTMGGRFAGHDFQQTIASSTIGHVTRTEMETKIADRGTDTVSAVERIGGRSARLTVFKNQSSFGPVGVRGVAVVEQRGEQVRVLKNKQELTLFGKKVMSIGRQKSERDIAEYTRVR